VGRLLKNLLIYLFIVVLAVLAIKLFMPPPNTEKALNYNQFMAALTNGTIVKMTLREDGGYGYHVEGTTSDNAGFTADAPASNPDLLKMIDDYAKGNKGQVTYSPNQNTPWWAGLISTLLPILLIVGFVFFMLQQTQGGGNRVMQFGRSRARLLDPEKKKVTFADVAGVDEAEEELEEIVDFLKDPKRYNDMGARIPKGVLLFGPPGTGKTLLARAIAGEAGVPFFSISGSDFVEMFVGVGAARVRDLFEQAKKSSPCIIFVDEIDAVGRHRGAGLGGGHDEREQTLNQLLVEMDGFSANEGIIIIAATNRPDILDPALLRPGRFDRQITVDLPDLLGRKEILKVHARAKPLEDEVDMDVLARRTPGFTGADLANMINEAALLSARRNKKKIGMKELEDSIERVIAGPEKKSRIMSEEEKRLIAYHEAGHAVVGGLLPHADPVHKISIIPRGRMGGYTLSLPVEDRRVHTKSYLLDLVTSLMGGRASESLVLVDISTGAHNDLERATDLVRKMITEYGMSEELGPITFGRPEEQVFMGRDLGRDRNYSEATAYSIDKEAHQMIDHSYQQAKKLLEDNIGKLHRVAATLLEQETIERSQFEALMQEA
jgi:cell division protease FtsH